MGNRYDASGSQSTFQPGSDDQVLSNLLGVTDPLEMDDIELDLLGQLYECVFTEEFPDRRLEVSDLSSWHRQWLGNVYDWAGELRTVNLAKDDFHFAAAAQLPKLLDEFQSACLDRFTPTHDLSRSELAEALAVVHVELVLIHPFREGNGRLARLLADVMAVQAQQGLMDYSEWDRNRNRYFTAIQRGVGRDYELMTALFRRALAR